MRSSAMMSRQMSTHSSQMKTVGPAISFLTSRWLLLQNEHLRASSPVSFFGISPPSGRRQERRQGAGRQVVGQTLGRLDAGQSFGPPRIDSPRPNDTRYGPS